MAKFCTHCGSEVNENATVCLKCGCAIPRENLTKNQDITPANTSIVLGIVGIVAAWIYALSGHITSIIGIVLGIRDYKESGRISGLVLSIIGEVCSVISSIIGVLIVSGL